MTDPCNERITAKVLTVLQAVSGLKWERNRKTALDAESDLDSGILFEGDETPDDLFCGQDGFIKPFLVQVTLGKSGADAATATNAMRAKIAQTLKADRTLGGLVNDLQLTEPGDWIGVDCDSEDVEGFMLSFEVRYATVEGDPFTFSN